MTRREFMVALIAELKYIEPEELQDVLQYYNEYFDDAGAENEQAVIEELGSPQKIGAAIRASSTIKYYETGEKSTKRSFRALWATIAAICAAPIAVPIAAALLVVFLALLFACFMMLLSLFIVAVALGLSGVFAAVCGIFLIPQSIATFFYLAGTGMVAMGLSIPVFLFSVWVSKKMFKAIMLFVNNSILRRNG